jgi:hypothetical protein
VAQKVVVVKIDSSPVMSSCTIFKGYQTSNCAFPLHSIATGTLAKFSKRFGSTGIRHPFFGTVVPEVFQERSDVTFMNAVFFDNLTFADEGITFRRSVWNHSPNDTAS